MLKLLLLAGVLNFSAPGDTVPYYDSREIIRQLPALYQAENYDKIIALTSNIPDGDTLYSSAQLIIMEAYAAQKKYEQSNKIMEKLRHDPGSLTSDFYVEAGNQMVTQTNTDKAIELYKEGLKYFPYNTTLHYNIGYTYNLQGKHDEALAVFQQVTKLDPFYYRAHQMMGNLMSIQGYRTKAMMSYLLSLAIEPDNNWVLVRLNNLLNDAMREEGTLDLTVKNKHFEYYDNLLRSRAAFDERYQTKVVFETPVSIQSEMVINKLKYVEGTDDFWMNFYVPFYVKIAENNLTDAMINFCMQSSKNEAVSDYLVKNINKKDQWVELVSSSIAGYNDFAERTVLGKTAVYRHWFYEDGELNAIGNETGDNYTGPWIYLQTNGRVQAKGLYNQEGQKIGAWEYYHDNGSLSAIERYNDKGELDGRYQSWNEEGILVKEIDYKKGKADGIARNYYDCGTIEEEYPYIDGIGVGDGKYYYNTGELSASYTLIDDLLNGKYTVFHENGKVFKELFYKDGELSGDYLSYYADGTPSEKGSYKEDQKNGNWEFYHENGKLASKGAMSKDKYIGKWEYYYINGQLRSIENYNNDGKLSGELTWYDVDGKLHSRRKIENSVLLSYSFYNKEGEEIHTASDPNGNMTYDYYYPRGQLFAKGTFRDSGLEGPYTTYHVNGNVFQEGTLVNNNWDGAYKEYNEDGSLSVETTYEKGSYNGLMRFYYPNGQVKSEGWYKDNEPSQYLIEYNPDGTLRSKYQYFNGKLAGTTSFYDTNGKLYSSEQYKDNKTTMLIQYDTLGNEYNRYYTERKSSEDTVRFVTGEPYRIYQTTCGENTGRNDFYFRDGRLSAAYKMTGSANLQYSGYSEDGTLQIDGTYLD
ncbi:MAG: tetratricopeptide repeat protein, partial [Cyclobacteriaceae bacterium]